MFPVGTGAASPGRQNIHVLPTGTYKVLPGQGPQGTDVVRTCSDVVGRQRVGNDDVKGRVGRVDGTCGYFATEADGSLPTLSSSSPSASLSGSASSAHKDEVAARHRALLLRAAQAPGRARSQPAAHAWADAGNCSSCGSSSTRPPSGCSASGRSTPTGPTSGSAGTAASRDNGKGALRP
jgi:hypothetical protein